MRSTENHRAQARVRGATGALMRPMIAIVGSRNASSARLKFAQQLTHRGRLVSRAGDPRPNSQAMRAEFLLADIVVLGAPMYNLVIPSRLSIPVARRVRLDRRHAT
jgi:hypothetical protein